MTTGGLLAGTVGLIFVLVGVIDALTGTQILRGDTANNSLLLALILIALGGPVWFRYWHGIGQRYQRDEIGERSSVSRKIYLIVLIGLGGLVALGSAIAVVYVVLRDVIESQFSSATLREVRYTVSILCAATTVVWYHLSPYQRLHEYKVARQRRVIIAGPFDSKIDALLRSFPDLNVEWIHTQTGSWVYDDVLEQLNSSNDDLMIIVTASSVHVANL
jgi:hypothetical protein